MHSAVKIDYLGTMLRLQNVSIPFHAAELIKALPLFVKGSFISTEQGEKSEEDTVSELQRESVRPSFLVTKAKRFSYRFEVYELAQSIVFVASWHWRSR